MFKAFYDMFLDWRSPEHRYEQLVKKRKFPAIGHLLTREIDCLGVGNSQRQADEHMLTQFVKKIQLVRSQYRLKSLRVLILEKSQEHEQTDDNQWTTYHSRLKVALSFRPGKEEKEDTNPKYLHHPAYERRVPLYCRCQHKEDAPQPEKQDDDADKAAYRQSIKDLAEAMDIRDQQIKEWYCVQPDKTPEESLSKNHTPPHLVAPEDYNSPFRLIAPDDGVLWGKNIYKHIKITPAPGIALTEEQIKSHRNRFRFWHVGPK